MGRARAQARALFRQEPAIASIFLDDFGSLAMHTEKAYWLPSHVRACSTATGTVLLDLQRNRYFGIGRNETLALRSLAGNWQSLAPAPATFASDAEPLPIQQAVSIADKLVQAGLISNSAPEPAGFTITQVDMQSLLTSVGNEVDRT